MVFDFDKIALANRSEWNKLLGKVEVFGDNEDHKNKFYTNLYRCYTGKSVMNDVNGKYADACQGIQELKGDAKGSVQQRRLVGHTMGPYPTVDIT